MKELNEQKDYLKSCENEVRKAEELELRKLELEEQNKKRKLDLAVRINEKELEIENLTDVAKKPRLVVDLKNLKTEMELCFGESF